MSWNIILTCRICKAAEPTDARYDERTTYSTTTLSDIRSDRVEAIRFVMQQHDVEIHRSIGG